MLRVLHSSQRITPARTCRAALESLKAKEQKASRLALAIISRRSVISTSGQRVQSGQNLRAEVALTGSRREMIGCSPDVVVRLGLLPKHQRWSEPLSLRRQRQTSLVPVR
jgi:hypothetical protein